MELSERLRRMLDWIQKNPAVKIADVVKHLPDQPAISTLNGDFKSLVDSRLLVRTGRGGSAVYSVTPAYRLIYGNIGESYFEKDVDERKGNKGIDPEIFALLKKTEIFGKKESDQLNLLQKEFQDRMRTLPKEILQKERNRLTIELSWKSSQIEGNSYSLLETEVLLSENIPAEGKEKGEATMLFNHKTALDSIYDGQFVLNPLTPGTIETIHSLLVADLGVSQKIRKRAVGITGTSYTPPAGETIIREYLDQACETINLRTSIFEKALLAVLFISYIQPFEDGNKRVGRIISDGILIENNYCPLSYRSVRPLDYKKAMILFYEQNSLAACKKLFIEQFTFAVENYFR